MSDIHTFVGFVVVAIFAIGWIWGLGRVDLRSAAPATRYWWWLTVAQVVAGLQAVLGIVLLLMGRRPGTWLHLVYGFGPLLDPRHRPRRRPRGPEGEARRRAVEGVGPVRVGRLHLLRAYVARADDRARHRLTGRTSLRTAVRVTSDAVATVGHRVSKPPG